MEINTTLLLQELKMLTLLSLLLLLVLGFFAFLVLVLYLLPVWSLACDFFGYRAEPDKDRRFNARLAY